MRLGIVTTSYPREPGDPAGAFVAGLARWLADAGHEVEVVAAGPGATSDGPIAIERIAAGAALFYDEGAPDRLERDPSASRHAPIFTAALATAVARRRGRWDAVVSHWLVPCGVVAAATGLPHVAVAHSGDVHLAARPAVADAVAAALVASGGTRVAFAGAHLRDRLLAAVRVGPLRRSLERRSFVQPMGIEVEAFHDLRPLGAPVVRSTPIVAYVGRLVPIKGVHVLVEAVARLGRPVQLVVGGEGPERPLLESLARSAGIRARFAGEVRGAARDALYAAADVLALPSLRLPNGRTEGTPTVALEALAAGVPLVASRVSGVAEATGGAAWLTEPGDAGALARAIVDVLENPELAAERVARGREVAAAYSWEMVGGRILGSLPARRSRKLPFAWRGPIFRTGGVRVGG